MVEFFVMEEQTEITLESLDKALEADLRAVVAKASGGKPLTEKERAMIAEYRSDLQKKSQPVFALKGAGADDGLAGLTQAELAARWGYSVRQVKNWIGEGKSKSDPCPIRHPEEMPAWFERVYAPRICPERLAQRAKEILKPVSPAEKQTEQAPVAVHVAIPDVELGLQAMLQRLREQEAMAHAKYLRFLDLGDESKADFYQRAWAKISEQLRAAEKTAPKALEEAGIYVRRDEVVKELLPIHRAIVKGFRQRFRALRSKLAPSVADDEWNAQVDALVDDVCGMLCETSFAEPLELTAA
ncbi:MAG: hypothetical protein QM680_12165 [Luteolibacter sp.]